MPRVLRPVLPTVISVLLACLVLFAGGLSASPMTSAAMAEAAAADAGNTDSDLSVTASEGDSPHAWLPMPAESEPGAGHAPALASPRPIDGLYRIASASDGPRTRSHAYLSCGPPR